MAAAEDFKVSKDAFVWEEASTFVAAPDDYQPSCIMITGGAGFIARCVLWTRAQRTQTYREGWVHLEVPCWPSRNDRLQIACRYSAGAQSSGGSVF